jgi:hypothetical protein
VFRSQADAAKARKLIPELETPVIRDSFKGGAISATNIRRSLPVYRIPIDELHVPDYAIEPDEKFVQLYSEFDRGRVNAYSTRVAVEDILDGFCTPPPACEIKEEITPEKEIERLCDWIRAGARPTLFVRENDSCPDAPRFFYTDGSAALKAYRRLGIAEVPVAIVSASLPTRLPHSSFEIGHGGHLRDPVARVEEFRPCDVDTVPAIAALGTPLPEVLMRAKGRLLNAIEMLRSFHHESGEHDTIHYHDSVYSMLVRAQEHVQGIELLAEHKLWSTVPNLQRTLYELSLTYYVDWLAPEQTYFDMSVAASLDSAGLRLLEDMLTKDYAEQGSPQRAKALAKRAMRLVRWLDKVSNKAAFAPIGIALHEKFYSALSSTAHQDFAQTAKHANRFRDPSYEHFGERSQQSLADFVNIVVGTIVSMADADLPAR